MPEPVGAASQASAAAAASVVNIPPRARTFEGLVPVSLDAPPPRAKRKGKQVTDLTVKYKTGQDRTGQDKTPINHIGGRVSRPNRRMVNCSLARRLRRACSSSASIITIIMTRACFTSPAVARRTHTPPQQPWHNRHLFRRVSPRNSQKGTWQNSSNRSAGSGWIS